MLADYALDLKDVVIVIGGVVLRKDEISDKLNIEYDNDWGSCNLEDIQVIVDDYTWFERTSYDGFEKFILKAHPILSAYENQESHTDFFFRRYHDS